MDFWPNSEGLITQIPLFPGPGLLFPESQIIQSNSLSQRPWMLVLPGFQKDEMMRYIKHSCWEGKIKLKLISDECSLLPLNSSLVTSLSWYQQVQRSHSLSFSEKCSWMSVIVIMPWYWAVIHRFGFLKLWWNICNIKFAMSFIIIHFYFAKQTL